MLLKTPPIGAGVERARRGRVDGQRVDVAGIDVRPVLTALQLAPLSVLLEDAAAIGPGVERARRRRIDGQRVDVGGWPRQAGVDALQLPPLFVLLKTPPPGPA